MSTPTTSPSWVRGRAGFFVVLLLPERGTTAGLVDAIMADVRSTCEALGVTVCGGHTEVTTSLGRPLLIGQMLGEVARPRLVSKANLQVGDQVLLTQGVAIEGTALLAREKGGELRGRVPDDLIERAERFLFDPGISVVEAALTATDAGHVTGMHDPTEGGLVTGLCELATASDKGLRVYGERVPIFPETGALCEPFWHRPTPAHRVRCALDCHAPVRRGPDHGSPESEGHSGFVNRRGATEQPRHHARRERPRAGTGSCGPGRDCQGVRGKIEVSCIGALSWKSTSVWL